MVESLLKLLAIWKLGIKNLWQVTRSFKIMHEATLREFQPSLCN